MEEKDRLEEKINNTGKGIEGGLTKEEIEDLLKRSIEEAKKDVEEGSGDKYVDYLEEVETLGETVEEEFEAIRKNLSEVDGGVFLDVSVILERLVEFTRAVSDMLEYIEDRLGSLEELIAEENQIQKAQRNFTRKALKNLEKKINRLEDKLS